MTTTSRQRSWIDLDGAVNVRDLGGLPVAGGGVTAGGVLVRADNLQGLSERDVAVLVEEVGVRVVVDLRTGAEVELEGPGPLVADPRVQMRHHSLHPEVGYLTDVEVDQLFPWQEGERTTDADEAPAVRAYLGYLRDRPDSVVGALRAIVEADGAAIVHCAAGKDRTGMICAMTHHVGGVAWDDLVADYLATNHEGRIVHRMNFLRGYIRDLAGHHLDDEALRVAVSVHEDYLAAAMAEIDARCGSMDNYLRDVLGLDAAHRARINDRILA